MPSPGRWIRVMMTPAPCTRRCETSSLSGSALGGRAAGSWWLISMTRTSASDLQGAGRRPALLHERMGRLQPAVVQTDVDDREPLGHVAERSSVLAARAP